eukprot:CAMPEP_0172358244 /NCGR_PEP_ID=MMETSP1060-20121228/2570_1 /TAXON_ID=37318 /ORGANISM="Pseudo-nitzschia pungens, Strain cf. cingulata" /LENGTH=577 /DNA_ID=CAMNT_0013079357 /DNA_START=154 /DNA_END=1887 /DNA_ORIENTATION=+
MISKNHKIKIFLLSFLSMAQTPAALKAGDTICTEGYVMDSFCIDRGTLFDNPAVRTLEGPEKHSIHCLIDVESCISSPFEVLLDPSNPGDPYRRGFRLDVKSQEQAVALARSVGTCTTCTSDGVASPHAKGFRAAIKATITDLKEDDPTVPPTISALAMEDTTAYAGVESACQTFFGMQDILDVSAASTEIETGCSLSDGAEICTTGFVMDLFCIDRGTLFDNPTVRTLEGPEQHSVHCLIDVESCISSPFEILLDPATEGGMYSRGFRLDPDSKQQAVALAQSVGTCTECNPNNTDNNSHVRGFRVAARATIVDLNANDDSVPPTIRVLAIEDTTAYEGTESACERFFGLPDIAECDGGSAGGSPLDSIAIDATASQNALRRTHFAHASLMLIGWGYLLPSGTLVAKFFKHRLDGAWFRFHRIIQTIGLLLALAGWIIALANFNVFLDYGQTNFRHGVCGMIVMILGLLQPLNAFFRPHPPEGDEAKSKARTIWEVVHKTSGWVAVALAVPTIVLGTKSLPVPDDQTSFQIGYGVGCIGGLLLLLAALFYDKTIYTNTADTNGPHGSKSEQENEQA